MPSGNTLTIATAPDPGKRCSRCVLPSSYPGIRFDSAGVCSHCLAHTPVRYRGPVDLKRHILEASSRARAREHCLVLLSGGRDSSYLLYYLSKVLGVRTLAYFADTGFVPPHAHGNIHRIVDALGVELAVERSGTLTRCFRPHLRAWMRRPTAASSGILCIGCKLAYHRGALRCASTRGIGVMADGWTRFEGGEYKRALMKSPRVAADALAMALGYAREIAHNPRLILNARCVGAQIMEYAYLLTPYERRRLRRAGIIKLSPFSWYLRWNEPEVVARISDLGWQPHRIARSSWRGDCILSPLRSFIYKQILGFNDMDDAYSSLVRDGQMSREEALERVERESEYDEAVLREPCEIAGVDFGDFLAAVRRGRRMHERST